MTREDWLAAVRERLRDHHREALSDEQLEELRPQLGDHQKGPKLAAARLAELAREKRRIWGGQPPAIVMEAIPRDAAPSIRPQGDGRMDEASRRGEAASLALAAFAATEEAVGDFREHYLGDQLLTEGAMDAFLKSVSLRGLSGDQLEAHEVPILGHSATVEREVQERVGYTWHRRWAIRVDPPGVLLEGADSRQDAVWEKEGEVLAICSEELIERAYLNWQFQDGPGHLPVIAGSVVDELRQIAAGLARTYPWRDYQAIRFVLTGAMPWVGGLVSTIRRRGGRHLLERATIQLNIAPWVPAESVYLVYRRHLQELVRDAKERDRNLNERALSVFRFVAEKQPEAISASPGGVGWEKLRREWNHEHPDQEPFQQRAGFMRAFTGCRDVLFPPLSRRGGDDEESPPSPG